MKPSDFLTELSNDKLTQYKTAAAADASKADKEGDFKKGDKRFSGIVKATKKQFDNDAKKDVAEGDVVPFPKKHPYELLTNCPKCGGSLQGGKDERGRLKMCIPCMTLYRAPIQQGVAEGILGSDPNRGQKVPDWAKRGIVGKIGCKLDPAWSDVQMTVPQHLLSKQSSEPTTNSLATKDMPKATSITPTRAILQRVMTKPSHPVTKNGVTTIADKQGVAEGSLEELANTSLKVKEPKNFVNTNDRKQVTYKVMKFKSGKDTYLINFTVKGAPAFGKKQNWNAVNVSFGVREEQDDYSFGDEINTDLTAKNKNQFLIYSTVINAVRKFITEYNTEIDEIIMQGAGERQAVMYQRFFQSAGKYFPGWHHDGKHSLVRDVPRQTGKKVKEQGVAEGHGSEELANEVYAEFERTYPNLARRADERTVHAAIMDVLNYGGDSNPSALAQDVARAVKQEMQQGVAEGQGSIVDKCASLAAKYFNSAGLQQQYDIDEFIKINTGDNVVVDKCASLAAKYFNSAGLQQQYDIGEYIKANVRQGVAEGWSQKYKSSINCSHPKGFSQKAHCAGKKKHNESIEMEMVCEDCGMCETHSDHENLDEACWKGYHKEGNKKMFGKTYPNCVKNTNEEQEQHSESCPHCGGELVSEEFINEKKDACYYKVKSRYKVWPSAYASGALVKCRNKGANNWGNGRKKNESSILEGIEQADESLHDWFNKEKWVRMDTKGNIKGPCAKEPGEGKPKCLPQAKAHSLGKKGRASAAARKRREDPNPDRSGKAINVNTKKD